MGDDTTDWRQLREFADVDLTQSFALSWKVESNSLLIDLDLYLTREHPFYEAPRPAEKACFRPAFLEFPDCTRACETDENGELEIGAAAKLLEPGKITGLQRIGDGRYEIRGEFGRVEVESDRPLLRIKDLSL
jgi:hypothetical protein